MTKLEPNFSYWQEYNNFQHVKHKLIRNYLNGWLPKLGSFSGRVVYLETQAGRGRHDSGKPGSPLVALDTVLNHRARQSVFANCEVSFLFIEKDIENKEALEKEINSYGNLPSQIKTTVISEDCFEVCRELIDGIQAEDSLLAPSFIFVDPYGFKMPFSVLGELMSLGRVELFVNVMWRELSMAIAQTHERSGMAETLSYIFGDERWRNLCDYEFEKQAYQCIKLIQELIGARWSTYIRMLGKNNATRYILMHLSNHDQGRDLMKDCIWKVSPSGSFTAKSNDDFRQELLITEEPDLSPLRSWVLEHLKERSKYWSELHDLLRNTLWRPKHLNDVIKSLRRQKSIDGCEYQGRFAYSNNPKLFALTEEE